MASCYFCCNLFIRGRLVTGSSPYSGESHTGHEHLELGVILEDSLRQGQPHCRLGKHKIKYLDTTSHQKKKKKECGDIKC